ncbi:MAG: hypothetical protein L0338_36165 [Acidobacteria bacterium]|nr:hypothetical protein [Acidobacteriota bacterium]
MGKAVWLFGWYVGRQTVQNHSVGLVLGGSVLTYDSISEETGWPPRTLQRWNRLLEREGYIELIPGQHGFSVRILNAKKFSSRSASETARVATNGAIGVKSGDPQVKSGEPDAFHPYMKARKKSKEKAKVRRQAAHHSAQAPPSHLVFHGAHLSITQKQDALLAAAFAWVDRPREYAKMDSWLEANPDRRPRKLNRFTHNWFARITTPSMARKGGRPYGSALTEHNLREAGFLGRADPQGPREVGGTLQPADH